MLSNLDKLCDSQAITVTAASESYGVVGKYAGRGEEVYVMIQVDTTFTSAGATTLDIAIQQCATYNGSYTSVIELAQYAKAALAQGLRVYVPLPSNFEQEFIKLYFTVGTGPFTAGNISAFLVSGKDLPYVDGLYFEPRNTTGTI
jgi:hypothetical protein